MVPCDQTEKVYAPLKGHGFWGTTACFVGAGLAVLTLAAAVLFVLNSM